MRAQQYILAIALALIITLAVFTFVPAVAAFAFLQIPPSAYANLTPAVPFEHIRHLEAMRNGVDFLISERNIEGLITFPSFHTVCGVIFAWALFPISKLRWWIVGLNVMMIASTPIEGAHYLIDVIAGVFVAFLAIWAAKVLMARLSRLAPLTAKAYSERSGAAVV